ncbi:phospholipase D family protein [Mycolicibacter sinensis]
MLEPDSRAALTEQLRPPSGFHLTHAVATTFTLDLEAALSVPLSFAAHRVRDSRDPIAILDAIRRVTDKVDVFAQAGQIFEPRKQSALFALLETMIHPVQAPRMGMLFHPKIWLLEYASGAEHCYRMLCASRNLTNDRSWDLVVRLDGEATGEPTKQSAPLSAFLRALPDMGVQPIAPHRAARIEQLADAVGTVQWELPGDARSLRFHPYGIPGLQPEPLSTLFDGTRHAIISPFISDDGVRRLIPSRSGSITILSRREQLDRLSADTLKRVEALILDDAANDEDTDAGTDAPQDTPEVAARRQEPLVGLHAKAYVLDRRSGSHLFIGSANATAAGFGGNVEMLVEFEGPQPKFGVTALLGDESPLRALAIPFEPAGDETTTADEEADHALETTLRELATHGYHAQVLPADDGAPNADDTAAKYRICLRADAPLNIPTDVTARATLLTRPANSAPVPGEPVYFDQVALTEITPFIVIRVTDTRDITRAAVVPAVLDGDIPGRQDAVIAEQLADRAAFMRLLALLLALDAEAGVESFNPTGTMAGNWAEDGSGLFETLVRAIGVEHDGLADVRRIIEHVKAAEARRPDGAPPVLPDGFDELWDAVWTAYAADTQGGAQ